MEEKSDIDFLRQAILGNLRVHGGGLPLAEITYDAAMSEGYTRQEISTALIALDADGKVIIDGMNVFLPRVAVDPSLSKAD